MSTIPKRNKQIIDRISNEVPNSGTFYNSRRSLVCDYANLNDLRKVIRKELREQSKRHALDTGVGYNASDYAGYVLELSTQYDGKGYYIYAGEHKILEIHIPVCASVHRYHGSAGIHVGNEDTTYLTAKNARRLANALLRVADSIEKETFVESNVPTTPIFGTGDYNLDIKRR